MQSSIANSVDIHNVFTGIETHAISATYAHNVLASIKINLVAKTRTAHYE